MKFIQVNPDDIEAQGMAPSRGSVVGPIVEEFLKTKLYMVEISAEDMAAIPRKAPSLSASIAAYAIKHIRPVRPVLRNPRLFLQRRDVDKTGKPIENWKDELLKNAAGMPATVVPAMDFEVVKLPAKK